MVFDGYEGRSTKDMTHMQRSKGKKGVSVSFSIDMNLTVTKEVFLNDHSNKQRFVKLLGEQLRNSGCQVFHDISDADLLIVKKTLESAEAGDTVLVGDDTDLLALLLFHAKPNNKYKILFAPEPKRNTKS